MELTAFEATVDGGEGMAQGVAAIDGHAVPFVLAVTGARFTFAVLPCQSTGSLMPFPLAYGELDLEGDHLDAAGMRQLALEIVGARPADILALHQHGPAGPPDDDEPEVGTSRLTYGDEIVPGEVIWWEPKDANGYPADPGWAAVLRIKESGWGPLAMILDRDGEQVPGYYAPNEVVRTQIPPVNPFDIDGLLGP